MWTETTLRYILIAKFCENLLKLQVLYKLIISWAVEQPAAFQRGYFIYHSVLGSGLCRPTALQPPPPHTLFPSPVTSPWRWRQQGPPKHWYPTTSLHGVTVQKKSTLNLHRRENPTSPCTVVCSIFIIRDCLCITDSVIRRPIFVVKLLTPTLESSVTKHRFNLPKYGLSDPNLYLETTS
jgi:hypothetical protein